MDIASGFRLLVRGVLAIALALMFVAVPTAHGASVYVVNDDGIGTVCGSHTATHATISTALTAASSSGVHTILVCPGNYGSFSVNGFKTLKLAQAVAGTQPAIDNPAFGFGGTMINVTGSTGVTIDGFMVDGAAFNDLLGVDVTAIRFTNSSGTIKNNTIRTFRNIPAASSPAGVGIYVEDSNDDGKTSSVTISHNHIYDTQTYGIWVTGQVKATITGNVFQGLNGEGGVSQTGISLLENALGQAPTGTITGNAVSDADPGIGIYLENVSKIKIAGNTLYDNFLGIFLKATCEFGGATNSNSVSKNIFVGGNNGIEIAAISALSTGSCAPQANKNTISGNTFISTPVGSSKAVWITFFVLSGGNGFAPEVIGNKVTGNQIWGFTTAIDATNAPTTIATKNVIQQ